MFETVSHLSWVLFNIKCHDFEPIFKFSKFGTKVLPPLAPEPSVLPRTVWGLKGIFRHVFIEIGQIQLFFFRIESESNLSFRHFWKMKTRQGFQIPKLKLEYFCLFFTPPLYYEHCPIFPFFNYDGSPYWVWHLSPKSCYLSKSWEWDGGSLQYFWPQNGTNICTSNTPLIQRLN